MKNRILSSFLVSAAMLVVPGCHGGGGAPLADSEAALSRASLENTLWKLVRLGSEPVTAVAGARPASFTLVASEHRVQGSTGCNWLLGSYELDGATLKFGRLATTRMACRQGGEQERAFLRALEATTGWSIQGESLELRDGNGATLAQFESLYLR